MGACGSTSSVDERTRRIDRELADDGKKRRAEVKLLLLGAGQSGKSTFAKQMMIIHKDGFSQKDRQLYKRIIWGNVISCALSLVQGSIILGIELDCQDVVEEMMNLEDTNYKPEDVLGLKDSIAKLWNDPKMVQLLESRNEFQLLDSCEWFLEKLDTVVDPNYLPDDADVLYSRSKTTGIQETLFEAKKLKFRMVDVGGQRTERRKWIHCFHDVTTIIFCCAISAYDQTLDEDGVMNRMQESLLLFESISNSHIFESTPIVLFLNKKDIFEKKIQRSNITTAFPHYTGAQEYEEASAYIQKQFLGKRKSDGPIYPHITCCTSTANVKHVFAAIKDIMLGDQTQEAFGV